VSNDTCNLGDRVRWGRDDEGIVVGVIERDEYADPAAANRWRDLRRGVLVQTQAGDVLHIRDADTVLRRA
jgi:hypothetical protein